MRTDTLSLVGAAAPVERLGYRLRLLSTLGRIVNHDTTPPITRITAQIIIAIRKASSKVAGSAYSSPCSPTTTGRAATASREPARATALLTPLAMPACSSGAAASTVAVSGAIINESPSPNTIAPGRTSVT